jgi:type VI protein secretion system component Hcp
MIRFRWVGPLVAVALVAGAATGIAQLSDNFTSHSAPLPLHGPMSTYLVMTGADTGQFDGGSTWTPEKGAIALIGLDTEYTSGDFAAGCQDISFRKPTDGTTPLLFNSLNNDESITNATFTEWKGGPTSGGGGGKGPQRVFQIKVAGGHITSVHHVWATTTGAYEDVTVRPTGDITYTGWTQLSTGRLQSVSKHFVCHAS